MPLGEWKDNECVAEKAQIMNELSCQWVFGQDSFPPEPLGWGGDKDHRAAVPVLRHGSCALSFRALEDTSGGGTITL